MKVQHSFLAVLTAQPLLIRLYTEASDTLPIECEGYGYTPKTLSPKARKITKFHVEYPPAIFGFSGPIGLVRGYYLTDASGKYVISTQDFTSPINVVDEEGGSITIHPKLSF